MGAGLGDVGDRVYDRRVLAHAPPFEPPPLQPFASESDLQLMPRWSPKGDRVAYVATI